MKIISRKQIEESLCLKTALEKIEQGFVAYSQGDTVIPPVASLHFNPMPGECHIKYGYDKKGKYYVVKIASGFPNNLTMGLPAGNGLMLLFCKKSGALQSILLDEGYLTDIRTAAAGCIAAKYLAPKELSCIGIIGTGAQAYYQLKLLSFATKCRKVMIWGRNSSKAHELKKKFSGSNWQIEIAESIDSITTQCNLIVTTTSSSKPLLLAHQIKPGTHITAVGTDDNNKQELDPSIFAKADKVIVDSKSQCLDHGDVSYAYKQGLIKQEKLTEIGKVIKNRSLGRNSEAEITVADLTGVAVQDLQIAVSVLENPDS